MCSLSFVVWPARSQLPLSTYQDLRLSNDGKLCVLSTLPDAERGRVTFSSLSRALWLVEPDTASEVLRSFPGTASPSLVPFAVASSGAYVLSYSYATQARVRECSNGAVRNSCDVYAGPDLVFSFFECHAFDIMALGASPNGRTMFGCVTARTGQAGNPMLVTVRRGATQVEREVGWASRTVEYASICFDDVQQVSVVLVSSSHVRWLWSQDGFQTFSQLLNLPLPPAKEASRFPWHCFVGADAYFGWRGTRGSDHMYIKPVGVPQAIRIPSVADPGTSVVNVCGSQLFLAMWWQNLHVDPDDGLRYNSLGFFRPERGCGHVALDKMGAAGLSYNMSALGVRTGRTLFLDPAP